MKVIHFFNELKFSGAEIMYVGASPVFHEFGCELFAVNTTEQLGDYSHNFVKAGYNVLHCPIPHALDKQWKMRKELVGMIEKGGYDVVHIHRSDLRWILSYCAWRAGAKAVYTAHNVFRSHWYSYALHVALRWSASHLFNCTFQSISDSVYSNERNYYHTKSRLIYNWYNTRSFFPAQNREKETLRSELEIPQGALVIVSVGGCSPIKRHTDIIQAMVEVVKVIPDAIYLHLGEGVDLKKEILMVQSLGLERNVRFCRNQHEVRKYLVASDIYVMTSRHEGIPISTIESMACKIPSILYDVPGLRDFNHDAECAAIIPEDVNRLAQEIISLWRDSERKETLTNNAFRCVNSKFSMERNAKQIFELYKEK